MTECRQIESLLPLFVDGDTTAEQAHLVESHLATCAACRAAVASERAGRDVIRAHRAALREVAPPGLRTRLAALGREAAAPRHGYGRPATSLGWLGRATAAGLAAALVLVVLTLAEFVPVASNVLFAAQVAVDHMRCFFLGASTLEADGAREMEREITTHYGWTVVVPASSAEAGVRLLGARRCPFGYGPHAHLLYDVNGRTLSLYITPGMEREAAALDVLGHAERVWSSQGRTYAIVARGLSDADLARVEGYFRRETAPVTAPTATP